MSGSGGIASGTPTGNPGGFVQGTNPFGGLTNTDLRPRRRKRRPVPLLDTSWVINRRRRRIHTMRKSVSDLIGTLQQSVLEITGSPADNREALLQKSIGEFQGALFETLEPVFPLYDDEPLGKGMYKIAALATVLRTLDRCVEDMVLGKSDGSDADSNEPLTDSERHQLDMFQNAGWLALRALVNNQVRVIDDEDDLERAEAAGELAKVDTADGDEVYMQTTLPEELHAFITDPLDLLAENALLAREFGDRALAYAEPLDDVGRLPDAMIEEFPELFVPAEKMAKLFPPKKKPPFPPQAANGRPGPEDDSEDDGSQGDDGQDDDQDDDQDADSEDDGSDPADAAGDQSPAMGGNLMSQIEMMVRLMSAGVVIGGSILQGGGATADQDAPADDQAGAGMSGMPDDNVMPLRRQEPIDIADVSLEKILGGEIAVSESVAEALEERDALRKRIEEWSNRDQETAQQIRKMQDTIDLLNAVPAAPKGAVFAVNKSADNPLATGQDVLALRQAQLAELAKTNPEAASRELVKMMHAQGGRSLLPPG